MTGWTWDDDHGWIKPDGTPLVPGRARRIHRPRNIGFYRLLVTGGPTAPANYR